MRRGSRQSNKVGVWRYWAVVAVLLLGAAGLVWRMVQLTVIDRHFLQQQGNARSIRSISIPAFRGIIRDRNGHPLAISSPVDSIWVNPKEIVDNEQSIAQLAQALTMPLLQLKKMIANNQHREFLYVKRHLDPKISERAKQLNITGVYFLQEYRRYYPEGETAAHVVGFTDIDDQGQEGMELAFDDWLTGHAGKQQVIKDRLGHVVDVLGVTKQASPGHDLYLSIDYRLQSLAYSALKEAVDLYQAKSGSVVVLDAKSGEVLAMVNQPSYNPNRRPQGDDSRYRNRAVTDVFEPGSTIKALSSANVLGSGHFTPESTVDTSPGWLKLNGEMIRDHHNNGVMTLTHVLRRSSNVGMSKFTLALEPDSLWQTLHDVGFGVRTQSGFPGEVSGSLPYHPKWAPFTLATLSFGYGMSNTTLQLAQAYSVLASAGIKRPVSLLKIEKTPLGKSVMSEHTAKDVVKMLEEVVKDGGTGKLARIKGYRVAGKTGTVRIVGDKGYDNRRHIGMFVGMAPANDPRIVTAVVIKDPAAKQYYGGLIAAPVFAKVTERALQLLEIPPTQGEVINEPRS